MSSSLAAHNYLRGSMQASMAVAAITFAATYRAFLPMLLPAQDATSQLCQPAPAGAHGEPRLWHRGANQLYSEVSHNTVLPPRRTALWSHPVPYRVRRHFFALFLTNSCSSTVNDGAPISCKFLCITSASTLFGSLSCVAVINSISTAVSVAMAARFRHIC